MHTTRCPMAKKHKEESCGECFMHTVKFKFALGSQLLFTYFIYRAVGSNSKVVQPFITDI